MEATTSHAFRSELHHPHDLIPELDDKAHNGHNDNDRDYSQNQVKETGH